MTITYQAYEHNDGGLYLVIYDQRGRPVWAGCDYELRPGSLRQAIIDIDDWSYDWSRGGYQDTDMTLEQIATELRDLSAKRDSGVHLIADQDDVYPNRMGINARLDFGFAQDR